MPSKNNMDFMAIKPKNTLLKTQLITAKAGRKPKPISEKKTEIIGLKFTKSELAKIKSKAGLIPVATLLRSLLEEKTDLLN